ncbi:MAG: LysM peptidoglycan-binding domain-containing protein, partial [Actinobacteria bacterium]|nr:LysM peptidoglycan-binding domain-containing protein [Actinomycetota bacterium]
MFSIPAAGVAKALMGVTISLHAAPAHHVPGHYTVKPGDTLSKIAHQAYGSRSDWPALWWTNRHKVDNPDAIVVG